MGLPCQSIYIKKIDQIAPCLERIGCEITECDVSEVDRAIGVLRIFHCHTLGETWIFVIQVDPSLGDEIAILLMHPSPKGLLQWIVGMKSSARLLTALSEADIAVKVSGREKG